jgi:thiamine pyrophosphokinase
MSSHHIVRDNQEPALLLATGQYSEKHLGQLLEWSPVLGVMEHALPAVLSAGLKVDAVFCRPALAEVLEESLSYQRPISIVPCGEDYEAILHWFWLRKHHDLTVVCDLQGGEVPVFFENAREKEAAPAIILISENWRGHLHKGQMWEKWLPEGQLIKTSCPAESAENALYEPNRGYTALKSGMVRLNFSRETWIFEPV